MNRFNHDRFRNKERQIREDYPTLNHLNTVQLFVVYDKLQEEQAIKEFLTFTVPAEKTIKELKKRFPKTESFLGVNDTVELFFDVDNIWDYEKVIKFLDSFGWYPAYFATKDINDLYNVIHSKYTTDKFEQAVALTSKSHSVVTLLNFEAKYDEQEAPETFYYHISPDIYSDKIDRIGLTPRSRGKLSSHPDRVYLLNPVDEDDIVLVADRLLQSMSPQEQSKSKGLYVYKIDPSKIRNAKFYTDPNFNMANGAVWTYNNIPPAAMEKEYYYEFN